MAKTYIRDFADGMTIDEVLLVRDKQVRTNRNGSAYLQMDLDDRTGTINARYWNSTDTDARAFEAGDFLNIKAKVQSFQGQLQVIVHSYQKADASRLNPVDFMPTTEKNIDELLARLRTILDNISNPHLHAIAKAFMMDDDLVDRLTRVPAGVRHHHAYIGGLIEHIVNMLDVTGRIVDLYPDVDADLLRMGVLLHDIGKVRELNYERSFTYTTEGQLLGHVVLGVEMLDEKLPMAEELAGSTIPEELTLRLKHLIVSHHGTLEFGSPTLPMTVEAIALHHIDNLDAKINHFAKAINGDNNSDSVWTPYEQTSGRRFFKGGAKR